MLRPGRTVHRRGEEAMTVSSTAYALPAPDLVLDRYRPLRPLGRGGSGSVWLARDERTGLEIALKIVPREGKRASRAAREMEAASRLRHERCVRAYDFGGDSGHVYIAYEYVQGQTMREALRGGKIGDSDAVEAAAQILDGLAHAHRLGIVHRDVKPSNVLVGEAQTISIRLLVFGLAQFDEADTLTPSVTFPAAPPAVPERLRGGDATTASDVWAVGVLLWESLAASTVLGRPAAPGRRSDRGGAAPIGTGPHRSAAGARGRRLVGACDRPFTTPSAERLAADLRAALTSPRRDRTRPSDRGRPPPRSRRAVALPLERRSSRRLSRRSPSRSPPRCCRSGRRLVALLAPQRAADAPRASPRPRDRALRSGVPARERRAGGRRAVHRRLPSHGSQSAGAMPAPGSSSSPARSRSIGALRLLPLAVRRHAGVGARAAGVRGVLAAAAELACAGSPYR